MFCCSNCFSDPYLIGILPTHFEGKGNCEFCGTQNVDIVNTMRLLIYFDPLLHLYKTFSADSPVDDVNVMPLANLFPRDFPNIFRNNDPGMGYSFLKSMMAGDPDSFSSLMDVQVYNEYLDSAESLKNNEVMESEWEAFVKEIRYENRFHLTKSINLKLLGNLFKRLVKRYPAGEIFYRGRISGKNGYTPEQIGKPPQEVATPGRANPEGISYLYLSNDPKTCIYEVRPSVMDYVTVGKFKLKNSIEIVSLKDINEISPFVLEDELQELMVHKNYLKKLESELSKTIRRNDSHLDYLPTQYLSEFIKALGLVGFEFRSSVNRGGYNLVVFEDDLFEVIEISMFEVENIEFTKFLP